MTESSTLVTLPQLIDLSLNCQEGLFDFQILHALLHIIIQQVNLQDAAVEFRGKESDRIQSLIEVAKSSPGGAGTQYTVKGGGAKKTRRASNNKKISLQDIKDRQRRETLKEKELRVIERRKDSKEDPDLNPPPLITPPTSDHGDLSQTFILVDSDSRLPQLSVAVHKDAFEELQNELIKVKEEVKELKELPGNMGLITATRTESSPILDMFHILNLTKRLEAAESGMEKLSSLVEDLVRSGGIGDLDSITLGKIEEVKKSIIPKESDEVASIRKSLKPQDLRKLEKRIEVLEEAISDIARGKDAAEVAKMIEESKPEVKERRSSTPTPAIGILEKRVSLLENAITEIGKGNTPDEILKKIQEEHKEFEGEEKQDEDNEKMKQSEVIGDLQKRVSRLEDALVDIGKGKTPSEIARTIEEEQKLREEEAGSKLEKEEEEVTVASQLSSDVKESVASLLEGVDLGAMPPNKAFALIKKEFLNIRNMMKEFKKGGGGGGMSDADFANMEKKFKEYTKQIEEVDTTYNTQVGLINQQLVSLQKEVEEMVTKFNVLLPGGDSAGITGELATNMASKLASIEQELIDIQEQAEQMRADKIERDQNIESILEQIDLLKIVKANREDLEDALGDKADACQINRKVSHDQFDAACDDLSRGLEEALGRLQEQEEMWHQALDAIQRDIGNKLDKNEVDPLRDFVNSKLRILQEKFKSLAALKREQEAAGTKMKLLKDVNCISCDKDVVMRREMDSSLKPKAYAMPPPRNMAPYLAYELDQLRKQQKCVPGSKNLNFFENALKMRASKDKDHLCNRYCGGSHTTTTPQQRVSRLGHFLEQWGPEIAPLNDEYIRGKDNHMYKARDEVKLSMSKQAPTTVSQTGSHRSAQVIEKASQQDRNTFIDPDAEEMLIKEEKSKSTDSGVKRHPIGSVVHTQLPERTSHISAKTSQVDEKVSETGNRFYTQMPEQPSAHSEKSEADEIQPTTAADMRPTLDVKKISVSSGERRLSLKERKPSGAERKLSGRMSQQRSSQQRASTIPTEDKPRSSQQRSSTIPNEDKPRSSQQRVSTIPDEDKPRSSQQRASTIPIEDKPRSSQQRVSTISNENKPRSSQQRVSAVPNEDQPRSSQQRVSAVPNEDQPRSSQQRVSAVPTEDQPRPSTVAADDKQMKPSITSRGSQNPDDRASEANKHIGFE